MLALMLYFLIVDHRASCHTLSIAYEDTYDTDPVRVVGIFRCGYAGCSTVLLPTLRKACSLRVWLKFIKDYLHMTLLGWLICSFDTAASFLS